MPPSGGVEPQSETVWHQADHYRVPRLAYINKMDRIGADFFAVVDEMKEKLAARPLILTLPIGRESEFEGIIHLLSLKEIRWQFEDFGATVVETEIDPARADLATEYRQRLVDQLTSISDQELADRLAAWQPPPPRYKSGVMAKYARLVSSAAEGAVTS